MGLVERNSEIRILTDMVDDCARGVSGVMCISGPTGSGKTALLDVLREQVRQTDARCVTATCSRTESALPLGVAQQLFKVADLGAADADKVGELLAEGMTTVSPASGGVGQISVGLTHMLGAALLKMAERAPLVVCVDDSQYADHASLQWLCYVIRRLRLACILVVFTRTVPSESGPTAMDSEALRRPGLRQLTLRGLSENGIRQIFAERFDPATAARLAPEAYRVTGGNPRLVRALIEDHWVAMRDGSAGRQASPVAADAFRAAVLISLNEGGPAAVAAARGLAILEVSDSAHLLPPVLGSDAGPAVEILQAAGLVQDGRLRHGATGGAVLGPVGQQHRTALHRRVARLLYEEGASAIAIARHLVGAEWVYEEWAVEVLRKAADEALALDDLELACRCLELALETCADADQRHLILTSLVRVNWSRNSADSLRHALLISAAIGDGRLSGADVLTLMTCLLRIGHLDDAARAFGRARASASGDPGRRAELDAVHLRLGYMHPPFAARLGPRPMAPARPAQARTRWLRAVDLCSMVVESGGSSEAFVRQAGRLLQSYQVDEWEQDLVFDVLHALVNTEQLKTAEFWCDQLLGEMKGSRTGGPRVQLCAVRAEISLRRGDLRAAEQYARKALTLVPPANWGPYVGGPMGQRVLALTLMGEHQQAAAQLAWPCPEEMFETTSGLPYLRARGYYHSATNRPYAALADFEQCGKLMREWSLDIPAFVPWRTDVAQIQLGLGNRTKAKELAERQLALLGDQRSRARGIALRVLAAASDLKQRRDLLLEAVDVLQECGNRLELAHVFADLSQAYAALGELDRARMVAHESGKLASERHTAPLCDQCSPKIPGDYGEDQEGGGPTAALRELTSAERRVAALAAQGYSNQQIARMLYVTLSTVEQHLTKVYRKLNVRRRRDLSALIATGPADLAVGQG
jgi:DNA-binding CsgD family transcriptional regulator